MRDSTEIICHLVARQLPRAGEARRRLPGVAAQDQRCASLSRTFGTVFIERILDLFAIAILGLAAGFWSFRDGLPPAIRLVVIVGIVVIVSWRSRC